VVLCPIFTVRTYEPLRAGRPVGRGFSAPLVPEATQSSGTISLPEFQAIVVVPVSVPSGMMTGFGAAEN
jgi:hypothetical protein